MDARPLSYGLYPYCERLQPGIWGIALILYFLGTLLVFGYIFTLRLSPPKLFLPSLLISLSVHSLTVMWSPLLCFCHKHSDFYHHRNIAFLGAFFIFQSQLNSQTLTWRLWYSSLTGNHWYNKSVVDEMINCLLNRERGGEEHKKGRNTNEKKSPPKQTQIQK